MDNQEMTNTLLMCIGALITRIERLEDALKMEVERSLVAKKSLDSVFRGELDPDIAKSSRPEAVTYLRCIGWRANRL